MRAFVTGSYAYGTPGSYSDIDLVVYISSEDWGKLVEKAEPPQIHIDPEYDKFHSLSMRFGPLNLLCCIASENERTIGAGEKAWAVWREGTSTLKKMSPVTRDVACKLFDKLRKKAGLG